MLENLPRGIRLFSPDDRDKISRGLFIGRVYPVMDIGSAILAGFRKDTDDIGEALTIVNERLIRGKATEFDRMELLELDVIFGSVRGPQLTMAQVAIHLPDAPHSILVATLEPDDDWSILLNPKERDVVLSCHTYTENGMQDKIPFFVPSDPDFLSRLLFSFSFIGKTPKEKIIPDLGH